MPDPRIGTLIRNSTTTYYAYVDGKYFEHCSERAVIAHLSGAEENRERYADMEVDAEHRFLQETIFPGINDLNTRIDSPLIPHFSPRDFVTVIQRCAKHHVQIIGIEIFDISDWPIQMLEVRNGRHARRLVKAYRNRPEISFAASFDVGDNVPGAEERRERARLIFEAALGGGPLFPETECMDKAEK